MIVKITLAKPAHAALCAPVLSLFGHETLQCRGLKTEGKLRSDGHRVFDILRGVADSGVISSSQV